MNGYKIGSVYLDIAALKEVKSDRHNIYDWDNKMTIELKVEDNLFKCVVVYFVDNEWKEYQIQFPVIDIVGISRIDKINNIIQTISENQSFRNKVENSKKHLKLVSVLSEDE